MLDVLKREGPRRAAACARASRAVAGASRSGERGWAEYVIVLLTAAVLGFAFLWALVLHEKPPEEDRSDATLATATGSTLTPPTLPPPRKYKTDGGVNVRQGPATNTTVITKLDDGTPVLVECRVEGQDVTTPTGSSNQWLRVTLDGAVGYVSAVYVDTGDDIEDASRIGVCT